MFGNLGRQPQDVKGKTGWVNFNSVKNFENFDEESECFITFEPIDVGFLPAKLNKLASWKEHAVFELVADTRQVFIDALWVLTMRNLTDGLLFRRQDSWLEDSWTKVCQNMRKSRQLSHEKLSRSSYRLPVFLAGL